MTADVTRIQPGWKVYGVDGKQVGEVREVGRTYVLVHKGWLFTRELYIPHAAIAGFEPDGILLNVGKDEVAQMGWDVPPPDEARTWTAAPAASPAGTTEEAAPPPALATDAPAAPIVQESADPTTATALGTDRPPAPSSTSTVEAERDVAIPVVEEAVQVGKQAVDRGGVRVTTRVEEVPVTEQVTLREETVRVKRRPVDRPASAADLAAFRDGSVEVHGHREEVVVEKQARLVEEVVIHKAAQERTETVQETVRRTDVHVEELPGEPGTSGDTNQPA